MENKTKKVTDELRTKLKRLIDNPQGIDNKHTFGLQGLLINEIAIFSRKGEDYDPMQEKKPFEELSLNENSQKAFDDLSIDELRNMYVEKIELEEENKLLKIKYPTKANQLDEKNDDFNVNEFLEDLDKKEGKKAVLENNIEQKPKHI